MLTTGDYRRILQAIDCKLKEMSDRKADPLSVNTLLGDMRVEEFRLLRQKIELCERLHGLARDPSIFMSEEQVFGPEERHN